MPTEKEITIGLSPSAHATLKLLKEAGVFKEMQDAYRFGVALAIAYGCIAAEDLKAGTIFNVGTLDPDDSLRHLVLELFPDSVDKPYAYIERLAEWGVTEMGRLYGSHDLRFGDIFDQLATTATQL